MITSFDDISLLDLIESNIDYAIQSMPEPVRGNKEAVAEIMENNVRSKIVEEHLLDPKYFEKMSILLQELIEARKRETISYQEYLIQMAALVKQVNRGKEDGVPKSLNTKGKVAIYHIVENEELALVCDEAVQYAKQDGFRENAMKQRKVKKAIKDVLHDEDLAEKIYQIIETHKDEY